MERKWTIVALAAVVLGTGAFCTVAVGNSLARTQDERKPADENLEVWHDTVSKIAEHYRLWEPVESVTRWAPELCMLPPPPQARPSAANEGTPHARKLYALFAKDPKAYGAKPSGLEPDVETAKTLALFDDLEQVVVKQAWKPMKMDAPPEKPNDPVGDFGPSGLRPVEKDGTWYRPGDFAGLYVLFRPKHAEDAAGEANDSASTDNGWVYATVTPKGEITGAGRMASCMECHQKHEGRLFGLPEDSTARLDGDRATDLWRGSGR